MARAYPRHLLADMAMIEGLNTPKPFIEPHRSAKYVGRRRGGLRHRVGLAHGCRSGAAELARLAVQVPMTWRTCRVAVKRLSCRGERRLVVIWLRNKP
jgi:hypothetical protein